MKLTLTTQHGTETRIVRARKLNKYFAAHADALSRIVLTHSPSGLRICYAPSHQVAKQIARRLVQVFGSSWDFTTPTKAIKKTLSGAKAIIVEHGGYR